MNIDNDYGVLISNKNLFIILSDISVKKYFKDIDDITNVYFNDNKIFLENKFKTPFYIVVKNREDMLSLSSTVEKYLSIVDENGELVRILEIKES